MLSALNSRKLTNSDLMFSIYLSHPPPLPVFHIKQSRDKRLLTHRSWFNIPGLVSWRLFRSFPHGHKMAAQFQASCLFSKKNGIKKEAGATGFICSFIRRAKHPQNSSLSFYLYFIGQNCVTRPLLARKEYGKEGI